MFSAFSYSAPIHVKAEYAFRILGKSVALSNLLIIHIENITKCKNILVAASKLFEVQRIILTDKE